MLPASRPNPGSAPSRYACGLARHSRVRFPAGVRLPSCDAPHLEAEPRFRVERAWDSMATALCQLQRDGLIIRINSNALAGTPEGNPERASRKRSRSTHFGGRAPQTKGHGASPNYHQGVGP